MSRLHRWCASKQGPKTATHTIFNGGSFRLVGHAGGGRWIGDALVVVSFLLYGVVFTANSFGASNVRVEETQQVASTGPYALVRHPMYSVGFLFFTAIALGIGSWWALLLLVVAFPVLAIRILDEEKLLEKDLAGYQEYEQKVRYRLVPYIW